MIELYLSIVGLLMFSAVFLLSMVTVGEVRFKLLSSTFADGKSIPTKYANTGVAGGKNISQQLSWANTPTGAKSFAVACIDRHPIARNWIHWLVVDIPTDVMEIAEGASKSKNMPRGSKELMNSFGTLGWGGQQPPPGSGPHKYEFILYALDTKLALDVGVSKDEVIKAMDGHILVQAPLVGEYTSP